MMTRLSGGSKIKDPVSREPETVATDVDVSDDLLQEYIDRKVAEELGQASGRAYTKNGMTKLSGAELNLYKALLPLIKEVASGDRGSTEFKIPAAKLFGAKAADAIYSASDLGLATLFDNNGHITDEAADRFYGKYSIDLSAVFDALLSDLPYELYWYDKEKGARKLSPEIGIYTYYGKKYLCFYDDDPEFTFKLSVSADYSANAFFDEQGVFHRGDQGTTNVNRSLTKAASAAPENIADIIINNASKEDYDKLVSYKDAIIGLTDYNDDALKPDVPYGNPWQLIFVFDGDPATNVVCEGYSKAFQYLCDSTSFDHAAIECRSVTGSMDGGVGAGPHMWNILHMEDGRNYLADITNSDTDSAGYIDKQYDPDGSWLFLNVYDEGNVEDGYIYRYYEDDTTGIYYEYDEDAKSLYSKKELTMSSAEYNKSVQVISKLDLTFDEPACGTEIILTEGEPNERPAVEVTSDKDSKVQAYWSNDDGSEKFEGKMMGVDDYSAVITVDLDKPAEECVYSGDIEVKVNGISVPPSSVDLSEVTLFVCINVEHDLTFHKADPVNCILKYWHCEECGMNFADEDGTEVLKDTTDTALKNAKAAALAELDKIDLSKYSGAERTKVENAIKAAKEKIRTAATVDAVRSAKEDANKTISAQKTNKTKALEAASNINKTTVTAKDIKKASNLGATTVTLGKNVKKIKKNAFKGTKIKTVVVKSKKLKAKTVKGSLKGSKVKTIKVKVGSKKVNKQYVKKYKKIFTKKNAGKKVSVK